MRCGVLFRSSVQVADPLSYLFVRLRMTWHWFGGRVIAQWLPRSVGGQVLSMWVEGDGCAGGGSCFRSEQVRGGRESAGLIFLFVARFSLSLDPISFTLMRGKISRTWWFKIKEP